MNRCGDCRYWIKSKRDGYGVCSNDKFKYEDILSDDCYSGEPDKFIYWDYEGCGHNCGFRVGRDFGCVHFKEFRKDVQEERIKQAVGRIDRREHERHKIS